jgi:hypothetical protein
MILPKALHKKLLSNHSQELIILLRNFCLEMKKIEGKVLNNKINLSNLFIVNASKLVLAEWGHSSFRQEYDIQYNKFESRKDPILKG